MTRRFATYTDDLEERMWEALDGVHDQDVTLTDYAKACAAVAQDAIAEALEKATAPAQLSGLRFGHRRVTKMYGQVQAVRSAIASEGTPRVQDAWDKVEEHIDFAYQMAARQAVEAAMADRPILFSAPMVRALLDGRKTQTRRIITPQPNPFEVAPGQICEVAAQMVEGNPACRLRLGNVITTQKLMAAPGDRLWVREAFRGDRCYDAYPPREWSHWPLHYEADGNRDAREGMGADGKLRSPIHMPRWASRITLTVTDVRVQRLQDIRAEDCRAEGCSGGHDSIPGYGFSATPGEHFRWLWDSLNADRAPWASNPWVCALTFTVQTGNIDQEQPHA